MAIWNRRENLKRAVDDWQKRGLLQENLADLLKQDVDTSRSSSSFSTIAVLLGIICLGFAAITFVAANWDEMSSFARVILLMVTLWISWGLSVFFQKRGKPWLAQSFVLLACVLFGAIIMLFGQIYHIQGNARDAVWLWALGSLVGAVLARSTPALVLTIMLFTLHGIWGLENYIDKGVGIDFMFMAYMLICGAASWWMKSRVAGHFILAGLGMWILTNAAVRLDGVPKEAAVLVSMISVILVTISAALFSEGAQKWLRDFERAVLTYAFLTLIGLVIIWYIAGDQNYRGEWPILITIWWPGTLALVICTAAGLMGRVQRNENFYDLVVTAVFAALFAVLAGFLQRVPFLMEGVLLALSIWMIRLGWRLEDRGISRWGFVTFTAIMLLIYFMKIGTLVNTSLFYGGAGLLILIAALVLPRLMKNKEAAA